LVTPGVTARNIEVSERRTRQNRTRSIRVMFMKCYPQAGRFVLMLENLNTRGIESL